MSAPGAVGPSGQRPDGSAEKPCNDTGTAAGAAALRRFLAVALAGALAACAQRPAPLSGFETSIELEDRRVLAVRVVPPPTRCSPCDTIIFSHGNNLSFDQYDVLLRAWAEAGYLIVAPLHVDSEKHPDRGRYSRSQTLEPRLEDYSAIVNRVADTPAGWLPGLTLSGRYFAAGHSYGAMIAQMAGGIRLDAGLGELPFGPERRPLAVVAISPPGPLPGYLSEDGWSRLRVPQLVVTGTADVVPTYAPTWQAHLAGFDAGPAGRNYALVFDGMDHYFNGAFGRLKEPDAASLSAVAELNDAVLYFLDAVQRPGGLGAGEWSSVSSETAEARFR